MHGNFRLMLEWINADSDAMRPVRQALDDLKSKETWEENAIALALYEEDRLSGSPAFLARLLYLVAERPVSVIKVQTITGLHGGHLYRFLDRGGVEYKAATVRKLEVEESCLPWKDPVYIDPLQGLMVRGGEITPINMEVVPSEDRRRLTVLRPADDEVRPVPLPPMRLPALPSVLLRARTD